MASHLAPGMSVSISGRVSLVNGVYLAVPVQVTCPVLTDPETAIAQDGFFVSITEKTGKTFAYGTGGGSYQSPAYNGLTFGSPVTCDGLPHTYVVNVFPQIGIQGAPNSAPFKGGKAVASGNFDLQVYDPNCGVYCADDNFISFGPQSISIQ